MADKRDERRAEAARHLALMKGAFAQDTQATISAAVIYEDGQARELELPEPPAEATATKVTSAFITAAVQAAEGAVAVVSPTAFTRPGGAYEDGSFGPEQQLCADSNLYPVLQGMKAAYHDANRGYAAGQLFTDRAMWLPNVAFVHDGAVKRAAVIAIPEPNRERALENHRSQAECDFSLESRITSLLSIAAANGVDTLVVGAFACGRQGFPAEQVIGIFRSWIDAHPGAIPTITFAVSRAQFDAFDEAFGEPKVKEPEPVAAAEEEDDEYFDYTQVELPEGITLR